jgi:serine/threonine protein kinase
MLTYAATGEAPFGGGPAEALLYRVVHARARTDRIPDQLRPLIESCLAKDPHRRPTTGQLLNAIELLRSRAQPTPATANSENTETISPAVVRPVNSFTKVQPLPPVVSRKRFVSRNWLLLSCLASVLAGAVIVGHLIASPAGTDAKPPAAATVSDAAASDAGPAAVVREFFTAINNHDWQHVWSLGGKNLNRRPPYNTPSGMAAGYRCTVSDQIKTLAVSGQTVSGSFVAHDANGGVRTEQTFKFSYLVSGNAIESGRQQLLSGKAPPGCA